MSNSRKFDGGAAYPRPAMVVAEKPFQGIETPIHRANDGMSLLDWFAGQALVGLINRGFTELGNNECAYAALAYKYADAMLERRAALAKAGAADNEGSK